LIEFTRLIPVVAIASDMADAGFVNSLSRPGGNLTGFSVTEFSVIGKMLETLRRMAPRTSRVAVIYNPDNTVGALYLRSFKAAAEQLAVEPIDLPVHGLAEIERAIGILADQPNASFLVPADITMSALAAEVTGLAARRSVPAVYANSSYVTRGGLVSYGPDFVDVFRRQASYVDRILRGEKPGDLPVQQPTNYQLSINLRTAKALGLTVPETLLASADEVIE
jgi:putative tryptophan/tyrosine transport system substrate-binding protein